jgi:hypothetical protein
MASAHLGRRGGFRSGLFRGHAAHARLIPFFGSRGGSYRFQLTSVTVRGVPFAELTQPAAVNLQGSFSG